MPKPRRGKRFSAPKKRLPGAVPEALGQGTPVAAQDRPVPQQPPATSGARRVFTPRPAANIVALQYPYVTKDLVRVGVVTGIVIVVLIVAALIVS